MILDNLAKREISEDIPLNLYIEYYWISNAENHKLEYADRISAYYEMIRSAQDNPERP